MIDLTPALSVYARLRSAELRRQDCVLAQRRALTILLARAQSTQFGREHGFARLKTVEDYQRAVPLRRYDDFWRGYWSAQYPVLDNMTWPGIIPFFANSSGTSSGTTKHIPVSRAMVASNRRAAIDLLVHHLRARPDSQILGGKNFFLGGSTSLTSLAPDVLEGDLSGIAAAHVPLWARGFYFPSGADARITDWEQKSRVLAASALQHDIRTFAGTPSWMLLFIDDMIRQHGSARMAAWWPKLEMLVHGGVSFEPYRARFAELLQGSTAETREVYPASEGFIAVQDQGPGEGLRLMADNGIFFEFVPLEELDSPEPTRHWLATVEPNVNYALVLSSNAGLWSYILGDTVRFVSTNPPRLLVTGRTSYGLSAFGEHLIGEEIDHAIAEAARIHAITLADFLVGPVIPKSGPGHHLWLIESPSPPADTAAFAATLDRTLAQRNVDYAEHRAGDFGMAAPQVIFLRPGGFAAWMKSRGKLGGQNKVPRVIADSVQFQAAAEALKRI